MPNTSSVKVIVHLLYKPANNESISSEFERLLKMRLLVVFLLMALIVFPTEGRRRRRRWFRIRGRQILTGLAVVSTLGKRDVQNELTSADLNKDGNIDQTEAENLFDKRDAEQILEMLDIDGDSVVNHDEFIRAVEDLFSQGGCSF